MQESQKNIKFGTFFGYIIGKNGSKFKVIHSYHLKQLIFLLH